MQLRIRTVVLWLAGWTAMGVLFALPQLSAGEHRAAVLKASFADWWSWGLIAILIVAADRRLPLSDRQIGSRILCHIPLSLAFTILFSYTAAAMKALLGAGSPSAVFSAQILIRDLQGMILWSVLVYWLILGGWLASKYYQRYISSELRTERLERLSTEARMHALRLQLDPHFLFNALNTISSQVEADPRLARAMIEHLGDLLRLSLAINQQQQVPLADELAFLDHYLAIQRIRFGDRLRFEQSIDEAARHAIIPSMTIQPLVENAIRHGIAPRASGGRVRVTAECHAGDLRISVQDDGVGLPPNWPHSHSEGLGLSVTRERIKGFYPGALSHFDIHARKPDGVEVELRIPLSYAPAAAHG